MLIGLDIGGTKIEGVLFTPNFESINKIRVATPKDGYQQFLASIKAVIDELSAGHQPLSIGIGCCGTVDFRSRLMQGANIGYLNGKPFLQDLMDCYTMPVAISNDANCLAISEFKIGAAKEADTSCLAVIIGTGCGGGIIANGNIIEGLHGLGGEIGHNPLPGYSEKDGPSTTCYCGSVNCIESFCSGTGFERTYATKYPPLKAKEIFSNANNGDERAIRHIEIYCDQVARVISSLINVVDPEIVVLGGGISNQDTIYPMINAKLGSYTFRKHIKTPVVKAINGDSSGVIGAAMLPKMKGILK